MYVEERPESVEITSVSGGNPWGGEPSNLESGGTILSGSVSSLGALSLIHISEPTRPY